MKRFGDGAERSGYGDRAIGTARALPADRMFLPLVAAAIAAVVLCWGTAAHAACEGKERTEVVGQVPDVFFTAGRDAQKTISVTYRTLSDPISFGTCGFGARVFRTGVSVVGYGVDVAPPAPATYLGSIALGATYTKPLTVKVAAYAPAGMALVELLDKTSESGWSGVRVVGTVKVYIASTGFKTSFVTTAAAANTSGNSTYIDHPFTNGNSYARLLVTPSWNPGGVGGVYNNHPIGVWYSTARGKWAIFNQDRAAMPLGAAFNVRIEGDMQTGAPIQTATSGNTVGQSTYITNDVTTRNPEALVMLTPVWNPPGGGGVYNNHTTAVWYDSGRGKPAIYNQDKAAMPAGASFATKLIGIAGDPASGAFFHTASAANMPVAGANYTWIDSPLTNGKPNAIVLVTPNWNPKGVGGTYVTPPVGVWYDPYHSKWSIFYQNGSPMPFGASFNVLVPVAPIY